jgi:hypothetical protein
VEDEVAPVRLMLGMLARSDACQEPLLDTILSIVGPSFDGVEILYDEGRPISDFGAARNRLIDIGEREGYDWMVTLDSDECMFPADIAKLRALMTPANRVIALSRYELVRDWDHYDPRSFPDYQRRAFRLGIGYRFRRRVHEGIYRRFSPLSETRLDAGVHSDDTPIFHYGSLRRAQDMRLKLYNYDRLMRGEPPVDRVPEGVDGTSDVYSDEVIAPFILPHPLRGYPLPVWAAPESPNK